jgi:hypothetical protein
VVGDEAQDGAAAGLGERAERLVHFVVSRVRGRPMSHLFLAANVRIY